MFNLNGPAVTLYDVRLIAYDRGNRIRYDTTVKGIFAEATKGKKLSGHRTRSEAENVLAGLPDYIRDKCEVREYMPL